MTPEEVFNQQVWEILQRIKEEILATTDGKPVKYRFGNVVGVGVIPPDRKRKILYKLEERKAFTIQKNKDGVRIGDGNTFYLYINTSKFNELYSEYDKLNRPTHQDTAQRQYSSSSTDPDVSPSVMVADLTALYSRIETEPNPHMFYLKIAVYGKYLIDHPQINPLLNVLYDESKLDSRDFIEKRQDFFNLWKPLAQDLVELADKEGIKGNPNILYQDLATLKQKLSEPMMSLWKSDFDSYYLSYRNVINTFVQEGKASLITPKYLSANSIGLTLDNKYRTARESWGLFVKLREIKTWWAHYQIMRLVGGVLKLKSLRKYFNEDDVVDSLYQYEFEQIGNGGTLVFLNKKKFLEWTKALHEYLMPRLKQLEVISATIKPTKGSSDDLSPDKPIMGFPHRLPAGTTWEQIIIKFIDEENVFIKSRQYTHNTNYKKMGFADSRGKTLKPGVLWILLKTLAKLNGEITIKDPEAKDVYKKQKELLAKTLQSYFRIDYDPFYPYHGTTPDKSAKSYKIKITLIPPPYRNEPASPTIEPQKELDQEIKDYLDKEAPEVYEENSSEKP